jgi:hypothetical protein
LIWQYGGGDFLKKINVVVDAMGRQRKRRVSIYAGTHNKSLIHWQFIKLIRYFAFLPGARAIYDTRVNQRCIDALELGQFRLASGGAWDNPFKKFPPYEVEDDMVVDGIENVVIPQPETARRAADEPPLPLLPLPSAIKADNTALMSDMGKCTKIRQESQIRDVVERNKENTLPLPLNSKKDDTHA